MKASFIPMESELKKAGFNLIVGMDEAGRGPLAGPVSCAAVILKENSRIPGLNDSKKLSKRQRESLFEIVLENSVDYSVVLVSHITIDKINILNAVRLGNKICIESLKKRPDIALIDGRDKQILDIPHKTIIKGDSKIKCIAAASILAKVIRDKVMEKYAKEYDKYGFEKHMGYGTRNHRGNIIKFGACPIHRESYSFKAV